MIDPTTISSRLVIRPFPKDLGYDNWIWSYVANLGPMLRVALSLILAETALPTLDLPGEFFKTHNMEALKIAANKSAVVGSMVSTIQKTPPPVPKTLTKSPAPNLPDNLLSETVRQANGNNPQYQDTYGVSALRLYYGLTRSEWVDVETGERMIDRYTFLTPSQLTAYDWQSPNVEEDAFWLNVVMTYFGINTNINSMRMFLATMMVESESGSLTLEKFNDDGTRGTKDNPLPPETRGAGYVQISDGAHSDFLKFMKDGFSGKETAVYISNSYFYDMMSSGWAWTLKECGKERVILHDYLTEHGGGDGVFLVVTYFHNGWPTEKYVAGYHLTMNGVLGKPRETNEFVYYPVPGKRGWISVQGSPEFPAPYGWEERLLFYYKAKNIWR